VGTSLNLPGGRGQILSGVGSIISRVGGTRMKVLTWICFSLLCSLASASDSNSLVFLAAPHLDTGFVVKAMGNDKLVHNYISLSWTVVKGAIGYRVYFSDSQDGRLSPISTVGNDQCQIPVACLESGIFLPSPGVYYFKVVAINRDASEGVPSNSFPVVYHGLN
jgi:hypothetical protein